MRKTCLRARAGVVCVASLGVEAQWLQLPTPGIPRLPGKPNLTAPAPRTADGDRLLRVVGRARPATEMRENERDHQRMMSKPAEPADVPAAALSRYVGVYDVDEQGRKHVPWWIFPRPPAGE